MTNELTCIITLKKHVLPLLIRPLIEIRCSFSRAIIIIIDIHNMKFNRKIKSQSEKTIPY